MLDVFTIITGAFLLIYLLQVNLWRKYWVKEKEFETEVFKEIRLSVIIPFKDEEMHLKALLNSLSGQVYRHWELILVNDHSTDSGLAIIEDYVSHFPVPIKIIKASHEGKKMALLDGAHQATFDTIITTDADCTFHPQWLETMAAYQCHTQADLIIGPVTIKNNKSALSRFQQIDFMALQLSGAAATLRQQPIMCNGANLLCNKKLYLKANLNNHIASGDDMFLLEWIKTQDKKISYIKAKPAIVETQAISKVRSFFMQRARWAAKAHAYRDKQILLSGLLIGSLSLLMVCALILSFWRLQYLFLYGCCFLLKFMVDYTLLKAGKPFFKFRFGTIEILMAQILYPLYVLSVLLFPIFFKIKWKDRNI